MADTLELGRRPFLLNDPIPESGDALAICPGLALTHPHTMRERVGVLPDLLDAWGPVLAVWEGYATDPDIRFAGSSGGAASALALFCIEKGGMSGVLHTGAREDIPYLNTTVYSKTRAELLMRSGSRYAPASPCEGLDKLESQNGQSVFIGKPCDVAATQIAAGRRPGLFKKLGLSIAFFCAGTPSVAGTLALLKRVGIDSPSTVKSLRYRGMGWPGKWTARFSNQAEGDGECERQLSYAESWGFLQGYRPWRCYICPDHSGEFADVAVGDPWYRAISANEAGRSLIVARTLRGRDVILEAERAGYLVLERCAPNLLPQSQPNLLQARGALWGRLLALRIMGAPVPNYSGFPMVHFWWHCLRPWQKVQSIIGTVKRVFTKTLRKRLVARIWLRD
jgi:coenzyme F420 hydrogenase subunit beta